MAGDGQNVRLRDLAHRDDNINLITTEDGNKMSRHYRWTEECVEGSVMFSSASD